MEIKTNNTIRPQINQSDAVSSKEQYGNKEEKVQEVNVENTEKLSGVELSKPKSKLDLGLQNMDGTGEESRMALEKLREEQDKQRVASGHEAYKEFAL